MKKILFQGDSITDAYRHREIDECRGWGYVTLVSAELGFENPLKYEFINRGIGGNKITDLYARMKNDILDINPDVMSVLIGVNDVWHGYSSGDMNNSVPTEQYEKLYNKIISEAKAKNPDIEIIILEPFTLKGKGNEEYWDEFRKEVEEKAAAAKRVAERNNLKFVPLMHKFDELTKLAPENYWLMDGIHPTAMGHELIKREWIKAFDE